MCPLSLLPSSPLLQDDDEWDDYRENKKDYTGLKIENLTVQETKRAVYRETIDDRSGNQEGEGRGQEKDKDMRAIIVDVNGGRSGNQEGQGRGR